MRHRQVHFSEKNEMLFAYDDFAEVHTNDDKRKEMKALLRRAIMRELTEKQRYCLIENTYKGRSMREIAEELGVNPSTVTRHIQNAKKRISKVAWYYQ